MTPTQSEGELTPSDLIHADGSPKMKSRRQSGALFGLLLGAYLLFALGFEPLARRSSSEEDAWPSARPVLLQQPQIPVDAAAAAAFERNGTSVGSLRLLFVGHELSLTGAPLALLELAGRLRSSGHIIR